MLHELELELILYLQHDVQPSYQRQDRWMYR